ncbi:hypothetical protein ACHAPA_010904 [Fusarium lateritium]
MALELTAFALAAPPTFDLSIRQADAEVSERILRLDNGWLRFAHQLSFASRVESVMGHEHRDIHEQTLCMLLGKIEAVILLLQQILSRTKPTQEEAFLDPGEHFGWRRKLKFVFNKKSLDNAIDELETWQRIADHSWFLILKIADPLIDTTLLSIDDAVGDGLSAANAIPEAYAVRAAHTRPLVGSSITIDANELDKMSVSRISLSVAYLAQRTSSSAKPARSSSAYIRTIITVV